MAYSFGLTGEVGGLQMSMIALGTVFIVIAFLMIMIMVLHKVCYRPTLCKDTENIKFEGSDDDGELIAVITAAVMQYAGADARLISFRPSAVQPPKKSAWRNFGRLQNFERNI